MTMAEIKEEVDKLPDEKQRDLLVYLARQREIKDPAYVEKLTAVLDDRSADRWVSLKDFKDDLAIDND